MPSWLTPPDPASAAWPRQTSSWFWRLTGNPALTDAVVTLAFALLAVVVWTFASSAGSPAHSDPMADLALVITFIVAVAIRRILPPISLALATIAPLAVNLVGLFSDEELPQPWMQSALGPDSFLIGLAAVGLILFTISTLYHVTIAWAATFLAIAIYTADTFARGYPPLAIGFVVSLYSMALAIVTLVGISVRLQRLRMVQLEHLAARLALERDQREQLAVSAERTRIAREMHDVLAHSLAIIVTMADGAAANLERNPKMAAMAIEQLSSTGRAALADTRRLVGVLRTEPATANSLGGAPLADVAVSAPLAGAEFAPAPVTPPAAPPTSSSGGLFARAIEKLAREAQPAAPARQPTVAPLAPAAERAVLLGEQLDSAAPLGPAPAEEELAELVAQFRGTGLPVQFEQVGGALPEDKGLQLALYRICQEALTNILRYSPNSPSILVQLTRSTGTVELVVRNTAGSHASPMRGSGKGVVGMQERAAVYGGRVEAGPTEDGWQVRAIMHWNEAESEVTPWMLPR